MAKKDYGQNMLLHTSYWGDKTTFKMMPVKDDCPFTEVIYDPSTTLLVVISKTTKENFQTVPRLDEDGNSVKAKKPKANGVAYKEQRLLMNVLQEHFLTEKDEQEAFIKQFAVNADEFNYAAFLRDMDSEPTIAAVEKPGLVDAQGNSMKAVKK